MRRVFSFITAVILLLCLPMPVSAQVPESRVLAEVSTGRILYEEGADIRRPVGSLAKLMTAYLTGCAIEAGELTPETVLTAGQEVEGMPGAVIWLLPGDAVSVHELLLSATYSRRFSISSRGMPGMRRRCSHAGYPGAWRTS